MKKTLIFILSIFLLAACSDKAEEATTDKSSSEPIPENSESETEDILDDSVVEEVEEKNNIDTSVFEYATNVEVTDGREFTQHITVAIDLAPDADPGMGTLNVLKQAYDFLQQEDIAGAETVTIYVRVNDIKVSQFKIYTSKFVPNDQEPMAKVVLKAADIEFLRPEVQEFGKVMELW
ncbi:membrane lipoprotein lipid attachment site-containing protein [Ureibacillus sp. FSL K6-2830]|uniref:membrane lipoprotein lipid attachment site-containing protein n=1 Tax=Ureibacillus sp. FSL K6-2830 TaxID=2954610 RepID=UPI0030F8D1D5